METSVGLGTPAEEIVENKTVRIENAELPPGAPGAQIMCRIDICWGCKRAGHTANSCPLTSFQQYRLEEWTEKGNDNLPAPPDKPAESLTTLAPAPQAPTSGDPSGGATRPPPMVGQAGGKTAKTPIQTAETSTTNPEQKINNEKGTPADRLLSSIGARTKARASRTTQPDVESATVETRPPEGEKLGGTPSKLDKPAKPTEKATNEAAGTSEIEKRTLDVPNKVTRPVATVAGKTKTPDMSEKKKTIAEQILHKLATTKGHPEDRPQTGAGKPKKAERAPTAQKHETDTGDSDEIIITHDGTKQALTEPTYPNKKKRHTTESKPAIVYEYKEANKTSQISLECSKEATQLPTQPVTKTIPCKKPQSIIPPLPPLSEVPQFPLKKAAAIPKTTGVSVELGVNPEVWS